MAFSAQARHLVGGEISYTCLGNDVYQIKLRVYRDCAGGGADFDAAAIISIFDGAGNMVQVVRPPKGPTRTINTDTIGNDCVTPPPGLCTEYAEYIAEAVLPPIPAGYVITHQRCCRNYTISNVDDPGAYGNTYTVSVPPNDTTCNSSPQFTSVPPIVLCVNEWFNLPMRVQEDDGDSLYYELCEVLHGGDSIDVAGDPCRQIVPNPPCAPPYTSVPFMAPFSPTDPMPASPQISIDSLTGQLSGKPTAVGQYLVGICVTEYRDSIPISTVRLDYQFNVSNCIKKVISDMVTPVEDPTILCDGLSANFTSESQGADEILWDFGDPNSLTDTSTSSNPSYTYSIPGEYIVKLIANPSLDCSDTLEVVFDIDLETFPEFTYDGVFCFEAQEVYFDLVGSYSPDITFEWRFGADANIPVADTAVPPPIEWSSPGKHYVDLVARNGPCVEIKRDSVVISNLSVTVDAGPDQLAKIENAIELSARGGADYYWYSDHPVDFSNPWGQNTLAQIREPADTVKFFVRASDPLGCEGIDSMTVFLTEESAPINYFTPNDDGINDFFNISDLNPDGDCRLSILNRWGSEVYHKENYQNDWKGIDLGGNPLPDGTYYYILTCDGEIRYKDAVTIMRHAQ